MIKIKKKSFLMYSSKKFCKNESTFDITCYSLSELKLIAKQYNLSHFDKINLTQSKKSLYDIIKSKMKHCSNERCWIENLFIPIQSPFKSIISTKPLSESVLVKLIQEIKGINFIGVNIYKYKNIPDNSVILFHKNNHWTVLFIGKNDMIYYDSLGKFPSLKIQKLMNYIKNKNVFINTTKEQSDNSTECGLYVLKFLYNQMNKKFEYIKRDI